MFSGEFEKVAKKGVPIGGGFAMFPSFSKNTDQALRHYNAGILMKMQGHKPVYNPKAINSSKKVKFKNMSREKIKELIGVGEEQLKNVAKQRKRVLDAV